ncbi:MAG: VanW family protein, partial [Oscillospiraceae bacterium]|nr:VanW family protein [Oscillospiraceae bacterium]
MSNNNSGNRVGGSSKPVTVSAVRKGTSPVKKSAPAATPFDFEDLNKTHGLEREGARSGANHQKFAKDNDLSFLDEPAKNHTVPAAGFDSVADTDDLADIDELAFAAPVKRLPDSREVAVKLSALSDDDFFDINTIDGSDTMSKTSKTKQNSNSKAETASKKAPSKKRRKQNKAIIGIVACVAVLLLGGTGIYYSAFKLEAPYKIINGIAELSSSNMPILLQKGLGDYLGEKSIAVEVDGKQYTLELKKYDFGYAPGGVVDEAYIEAAAADGATQINKISAIGSIKFNETAIRNFINNVASEHGTPMKLPSYEIKEANLMVYPGKDGMSIDYDALTKAITDKICKGDYSVISMEIATLPAPAVDMDKIYKEVKCEPINATVSVGPDGVANYVDEITGKDFNVENAKSIVAKGGSSWTIPLTLSSPAVTVAKLKAPTCPDSLSSCDTKYSESNANRSNNVKLAGKYVNGTVLQPGEIFSFNGTVGKRTQERGFKSATVYSGEGLDEDFGGGICQTSSTIYYACIKADLEIVQRVNHYFTVGYWPMPGGDATVSWGGPDLKVKNNKEYPIKLVIESGNGRITCKVMGTITDSTTSAYFEHEVTKSIPYETVHKQPVKGKPNKNTSGANGMVVKTYRVVTKNGSIVSRKLETTSTYRPL